jgi:hypothetical protein
MRTIWVGHVVCTGDNYTQRLSCKASWEERPFGKVGADGRMKRFLKEQDMKV